MWRTQLNRAISEIRFNLKSSSDHHGIWRWVNQRLPEVRLLNQNTFFVIHRLGNQTNADSAVHIVYGDVDDTTEEIITTGLTFDQFEEELKTKVEVGLTLERAEDSPELPVEIVETQKYVKYMDDEF